MHAGPAGEGGRQQAPVLVGTQLMFAHWLPTPLNTPLSALSTTTPRILPVAAFAAAGQRFPDDAQPVFQRGVVAEALDRAAAGIGASVAAHGPKSFGIFSCSKATNEVNYLAQKFTRQVIGTNNIDSCNRT